jgi:hypothetical protein
MKFPKLFTVSLATIGLVSTQLSALASEESSLDFTSDNAETRVRPVDVNLALDSGGGEEFAIDESTEWNAEAFEGSLSLEAGVGRKKPAAPHGGRPAPRGGSSSTYGGTTFYSKGGSSSSYGGTTFYSRGGSSSTYGGTTFYSQGGSSSTYGGTTFYSDGGSSSTYGGTTFFSKGGSCSSYGGTSFCT